MPISQTTMRVIKKPPPVERTTYTLTTSTGDTLKSQSGNTLTVKY